MIFSRVARQANCPSNNRYLPREDPGRGTSTFSAIMQGSWLSWPFLRQRPRRRRRRDMASRIADSKAVYFMCLASSWDVSKMHMGKRYWTAIQCSTLLVCEPATFRECVQCSVAFDSARNLRVVLWFCHHHRRRSQGPFKDFVDKESKDSFRYLIFDSIFYQEISVRFFLFSRYILNVFGDSSFVSYFRFFLQ